MSATGNTKRRMEPTAVERFRRKEFSWSVSVGGGAVAGDAKEVRVRGHT